MLADLKEVFEVANKKRLRLVLSMSLILNTFKLFWVLQKN